MEPVTMSALLVQCLASAGVRRTFGSWTISNSGGLSHHDVSDPEMAIVLADADGKVNGGLGAALLDDGLVHLSCRPGGVSPVVAVKNASELLDLFTEISSLPTPSTTAFAIEFDLDAPVENDFDIGFDIGSGPFATRIAVPFVQLGKGVSAPVLVGPGIVNADPDSAADLARTLGVALFNTFGAKGVVRWDDPIHGGTIGLQTRDLELAGIGPGMAVITCGIDPDEVGSGLDSAMVIDIDPRSLRLTVDSLTSNHPSPRQSSQRPPHSTFFDEVAGVVGSEYEARSLTAPRFASQLVGRMPVDGVVVADAGTAGFWVGRCSPTERLGSVIVPAIECDGFGVAGAAVAAAAGRKAIAVVDGRPDELSLRLIEWARSCSLAFGVQCMRLGDGGGDPRDHKIKTDGQWKARAGEPVIDSFAVDDGCLVELVERLGDIRSWDIPRRR